MKFGIILTLSLLGATYGHAMSCKEIRTHISQMVGYIQEAKEMCGESAQGSPLYTQAQKVVYESNKAILSLRTVCNLECSDSLTLKACNSSYKGACGVQGVASYNPQAAADAAAQAQASVGYNQCLSQGINQHTCYSQWYGSGGGSCQPGDSLMAYMQCTNAGHSEDYCQSLSNQLCN